MKNKEIHIQGVVFDFFGVLVGGADSQRDRWRYMARQFGMEADAFMAALAQAESYEQMQAGRITQQEWWRERMAALGVEASRHDQLHDQLFDRWGINPYCVDLIEALRANGVRLALLSNASGPSENLKEKHPVLADFDALVLSGEIGISKPAPGAFRAVERALNLPPHALLFVDDVLGNVLGAQYAGWQSHHFKNVETLRLELEAWSLL